MSFTYLIGWSNFDKWYYGCRFADGCSPSDLWTTYFTSSKHVHQFREQYGEPDVVEVRKMFVDENKCREWESRVLRKIGVVTDNRWLNKFDGKCFDRESILRGASKSKNRGTKVRVGKRHSEKTKRLMSEKRKGVVPNRSEFAKKKCLEGSIKSGTAAYKNKTGIHAFTSEQKQQLSIKGKTAFLTKWQIPEFRELHRNKIRLGRLASRLKKAFRKIPSAHNAFGFDFY